MKILHICLGNYFVDNYTYQENLLTKYHKKMGCEVEVIASLETFDTDGNTSYLKEANTYYNENDIKVTRLKYFGLAGFLSKKFKMFVGLYRAIAHAKPDIIFIHNCQFLDIRYVVKYLKTHRNVKVFVDSHADYSNSATNWFSKNILHKFFWRRCAHLIEPYATKFYGVLPTRVDFLVDLYKLPKEKCELLVMGVDDEMVDINSSPKVRERVRNDYNILDDEYLIVTGGKIDLFKKQTLLLMDAVNNMSVNIKLIVFGSVIPELKKEVEKRCSEKVKYIGWLNSKDTYQYFSACDFAVFPGRHSVIWEQVAGQGVPLIVKYWDGTTHIDCGGNVNFLYNDSVEEIMESIEQTIENLDEMKKRASEFSGDFLYSEIAKRSICL